MASLENDTKQYDRHLRTSSLMLSPSYSWVELVVKWDAWKWETKLYFWKETNRKVPVCSCASLLCIYIYIHLSLDIFFNWTESHNNTFKCVYVFKILKVKPKTQSLIHKFDVIFPNAPREWGEGMRFLLPNFAWWTRKFDLPIVFCRSRRCPKASLFIFSLTEDQSRSEKINPGITRNDFGDHSLAKINQ